MAREYAGPYPAIAGCESNGDGWAIIASNPASQADGVLVLNQVTLVPAGTAVTLISMTLLRVGVHPATKNRHFRVELYDGDGVDRETFGHYRATAEIGIAGATGYAYAGAVGRYLEKNKRGTNGLQVWCRGYADGGHVRVLVRFRQGT